MTVPNRNTLWGETIIEELYEQGVEAACVAPGSRSTPLTVAATAHPEMTVFSHLDERSSAFFGLGRGKRTGTPTALICTSGTAGANFHPAVMEASEGRTPLIVLTADRPPELRDSGANQTTDQEKLYGDAVRYYRTLPEPEAEDRKLRSLRVAIARSVSAATGTPPGPVHLNVPFRKPLEPTPVEGDIPEGFAESAPLAATGRDGPYVKRHQGDSVLDAPTVESLGAQIADTAHGLIVCGPANEPTPSREAVAALSQESGFPVLADPLSGHRFGHDGESTPICGGYDSYITGVEWPEPELVLRFGASPTSKRLRKYLAGTAARQILVDPAGEWREAEFVASDLVVADPTAVSRQLTSWLRSAGENADSTTEYVSRFCSAEEAYWDLVKRACQEEFFEGAVLYDVADALPPESTCFVSNSMPVRDLDRFGKPRESEISVLGNRGVSGIDGIISSALGAGSCTDQPLVLVTGDIALYHDMNGLLALARCGVDATIVLIDNDGGGIFHKLPIESFEPPFTEQFKTPHGLDFSATAQLYDLTFERIEGREAFKQRFEHSVEASGTQLLSVEFDSETSHRFRDALDERVHTELL